YTTLFRSRLRNAMRDKCLLVLEMLRKHAPRGVSWTHPEGGLNLWLSLPSWADGAELAVIAQREGILILPGAVCYANEPEPRHIRISFSYLGAEELKEGIIRLCQLLNRYLEDGRSE